MAALALLFSACGDDEEEDEHADMAMSSEADDEEDEHAGMAMSSEDDGDEHEEAHDDTMPGVVHAKPAGASEIRVSLAEWTVEPSVIRVAAGEIYFLVDNLGPEHPHEFVVIRTDLAPDALPTIHDGSVPEDEIDLVGEIEEFAPASSASMTLHLEPGSYLLICNIVEETGAMESHYREGMRVALIVE